MKRISIRCALSCLVAVVLVHGCGNSNLSQPAGKAAPAIISARSLSMHYAEVEFERSIFATVAEEADSYRILDPSGDRLAVLDVQVSEAGTEAILATEEQQGVDYDIAVGVGSGLDGSLSPLANGEMDVAAGDFRSE